MPVTISELRAEAREAPVRASLHAQAAALVRKESSNGKPFYEVQLRDATSSLTLRAWCDSPAFAACEGLDAGAAVGVEGEFFWNGPYGLDARRWTLAALDAAGAGRLFSGGESPAAALDEAAAVVAGLSDPRLRGVCEAFLGAHGARFARAAAARRNHHARRGGLLAHTLQMLRSAAAICGVYPGLNRDLLLAGTLLHDSGKLWETCPPERGFDIAREARGELLGHIAIGVELVNALWRGLPLDDWARLAPPTEDVRLHLLHLIASHHGELEFGSPVQPKTPEASALHFLDNLDARIEMLGQACAETPEEGPGVHERCRALGIHPVAPLAPFVPPE